MGIVLNGVITAALFATVLYALPRSMAYNRVLDENLAVKEKLQGLDEKMREVDRLLLRLRLYDAQLRSLSEPRDDHGPTDLDAVDFANVDADGKVLEEFTADEPGGLRSPEDWAAGVQDRADTFLERMERLEPNLTELVVELEDLRALEAALPKLWPTAGRLSSGFGWRRDPVRGTWKFHSGLDIANRHGIAIVAAAPGVVKRAHYSAGYGRVVEIEHGYGITTVYAHCRRLFVKKGDRVREGQRIAQMGSSGRSTGPHLHYEVRLDGNAVDPMDYVPRGTKPKP